MQLSKNQTFIGFHFFFFHRDIFSEFKKVSLLGCFETSSATLADPFMNCGFGYKKLKGERKKIGNVSEFLSLKIIPFLSLHLVCLPLQENFQHFFLDFSSQISNANTPLSLVFTTKSISAQLRSIVEFHTDPPPPPVPLPPPPPLVPPLISLKRKT